MRVTRCDAKFAPSVGKERFRIIGHHVTAILHDLHVALISIFFDYLPYRVLRNPDLIAVFIEGNYAFHYGIDHHLRLDDT